jgi:hypothetical protein
MAVRIRDDPQPLNLLSWLFVAEMIGAIQFEDDIWMSLANEEDWASCFYACSNQQNHDVLIQANHLLSQELIDHPDVVLFFSATIVLNSRYPIGARQMAAAALAHSIKPSNPQILAQLRRNWEVRPELANLAKGAIQATLLCDDILIRNQAARSFALVLEIEKDGCADVLRQVCDSLSRSLNSPVQATGLLLVFMEILHMPFFSECKTPVLFECFTSFFLQAISILGSVTDIHIDLRQIAGDCVRDTIEFIPEICVTGGAPDVDKIGGVLAALPPALALFNLHIFQCCHRIMFNLVKLYYSVADQFMEFIFNHTVASVGLNDPGQEKFQQAGIVFWKELAILEVEIEDQSHPSKLVSSAAPIVLPLFFSILSAVSISDIQVEDLTEQSSSMHFGTRPSPSSIACAPWIFTARLRSTPKKPSIFSSSICKSSLAAAARAKFPISRRRLSSSWPCCPHISLIYSPIPAPGRSRQMPIMPIFTGCPYLFESSPRLFLRSV